MTIIPNSRQAIGAVADLSGPQPFTPTCRYGRQTSIEQGRQMVGATKLPSSSYASSIDEAQTLVRRCAEPRPAGDQVKAAIRRASRRLGLPFTRTRDIWYGDARRIDAEEMDRLRHGAENAEFAQAVAGIQVLRNRMLESNLPASRQVFAALTAALSALGLHAEGCAPDERSPHADLSSTIR
jgi:hypothetical protein